MRLILFIFFNLSIGTPSLAVGPSSQSRYYKEMPIYPIDSVDVIVHEHRFIPTRCYLTIEINGEEYATLDPENFDGNSVCRRQGENFNDHKLKSKSSYIGLELSGYKSSHGDHLERVKRIIYINIQR